MVSAHVRRGRRIGSAALGTAISMAVSAALHAADTSNGSDQLQEIVVTGIRASLESSLSVKQLDDHVVEAISADSLGQMPNVTVAESLVRLPGVNGARDRGNESLATVRGLGPRLTLGTVNGREIASSEPNRNVRWEVFPTEEVSTVKVYKTQSADLIAGGVAGTIDISTISPLDYHGPGLTISGGPTYYDEARHVPGYSTWGERGGISWVNKFSDDLGLALSASYQDQKNGYPEIGSWGFTDSTNSASVNGTRTTYTPWGAADELKQLDQKRLGLSGALQWHVGNFDSKLDALYSKIKISEDQNQTWFQNWAYSIWSSSNPYTTPGSSYTLAGDDVVAATLANSYERVDHVVAHYNEDKTLTAAGWNTKWTGDRWSGAIDLSYSEAKRTNQWLAIDLVEFPATVSWDFRNGVQPSIAISSNALDASPTPSWNGSAGQSAGPEELKDQISAVALNGSRKLEFGGLTAFEFGVRYSDRVKQHHYFSWTQAGQGVPLSAIQGEITYFDMPNLNVPQLVGGNVNTLANTLLGGWNSANMAEDLLQHWKVTEKTTEGFAKLNYSSEWAGLPVKGNAGVRVVHVTTDSLGYDSVTGNSAPTAAFGGTSYTDVLPSATLIFSLTDDQLLRLAGSKALSKPPLDELATGRSLANPATSGTGQLSGGGPNPALKPFVAWQADVSYEWYFHKEAMLALAGYRKWVQSIIGYKTDHQTINGLDYLISGPFNGGGGSINGLEMTFQTPFYWWEPLKNFGIYSNYAFVDSNLKEFSPANNPFPLAGLARHTAATDLWYNNGTIELRAGVKYHSPYTIIYGWNSGLISRLQSETIYDASAMWTMSKDLFLKFQVNNLTNAPLRTYFNNDPNQLANKDGSGGYQLFGRRYMLELTFQY